MKRRVLIVSVGAVALAACMWSARDKAPAETKIKPHEVAAPSRIEVHIPEGNEPINVYSDEIPLTNGWQAYTQDTCRRFGIDYSLMLGLMDVESDFNFTADSGWAYGITQIGYINEDWLADQGIDIYTKQGNITAACLILSDYLSRYDVSMALMAYNEGEYGAAESWDEGIFESDYSRDVMEAAEYWRVILDDCTRN